MTADPRPAPPEHWAGNDKCTCGHPRAYHPARKSHCEMSGCFCKVFVHVAPPEHAHRHALVEGALALVKVANNEFDGDAVHPERERFTLYIAKVRAILVALAQDSAGFARTPESAAGTAEPVAWQLIGNGTPLDNTFRTEARAQHHCEELNTNRVSKGGNYTYRPLYLHPAPPPSVGATPSPEPTNELH